METIKFKAGDLIKCNINIPLPGNKIGPPLTLGADYPVVEVIKCPHCGTSHLDLGFPSEQNYISCYDCKGELPGGENTHFCHPSRFSLVKSFL